jgi:hypothetical protein
MRIVDERYSKFIENKEYFATRETAERVICTYYTLRSEITLCTLHYLKNQIQEV